MQETKCLICGSSDNSPYLKLTDRLNPTSGEIFQLVRCECGFVFLNPRPDEIEIHQYYNSPEYDPHKAEQNNLFDNIYRLTQKFTFQWKYKKITNFQSQGSLLDIGGGRGDFCQFMKEQGWETVIHDQTNLALIQAQKAGLKVNSNLKDLQGGAQFDIITLWHAMEHIHNLNHLFVNVNRLLKKTGYLLIAVPNFDAAEKKYFLADWAPFDAPRHLYHFTILQLEKLMLNNGYQVLATYSMPLDTPYNILLSLPNRSMINLLKAIYILLISIGKIIKLGVRCSSAILMICKKNT